MTLRPLNPFKPFSPFKYGVRSLVSQIRAISAIKKKVVEGTSDASILVIGDSTGDATTEWVYLFAQWLSSEYPTHSVDYYGWDDATTNYLAPIQISTGTGSRKITFWNASLSGSRPDSWMSDRYASAISGKSADLVIWNHGHNVALSALNQTSEADYSPWVERVQIEYPFAGTIITAQNPNRDNEAYTPKALLLGNLKDARNGVSLLDVHSRFIADGKPVSYYSDNVHPNATGEAVWADVLKTAWMRAPAGDEEPPEIWTATTGENLLDNGDFSDFNLATPTRWTKGGTGTCTKSVTTVYGSAPYSVKLESNPSSVYLNQVIAAPKLALAKANGKVSLAVRRYCEPSAVARVGLTYVAVVSPTEGTKNYLLPVPSINPCTGAWHWVFVRDIPVPNDASAVGVYIYSGSLATAGPVTYFDRVSLVVGSKPKDISP